MVKDFEDKLLRGANAPECADVVEAVINTVNEGLDAFADGKITLGEIIEKVLSLFGDWAKAGKDIKLVDDEIRAVGWETVTKYVIQDIDEGLVFPENMAKIEYKVDAAIAFAKAFILFYLAMAKKD